MVSLQFLDIHVGPDHSAVLVEKTEFEHVTGANVSYHGIAIYSPADAGHPIVTFWVPWSHKAGNLLYLLFDAMQALAEQIPARKARGRAQPPPPP